MPFSIDGFPTIQAALFDVSYIYTPLTIIIFHLLKVIISEGEKKKLINKK